MKLINYENDTQSESHYDCVKLSILKCYKCLLRRNKYSKAHLHLVSLHCSFPIKKKKSLSLINTKTGTINYFAEINTILIALACTMVICYTEDLLPG